jgi:hypothetical protein
VQREPWRRRALIWYVVEQQYKAVVSDYEECWRLGDKHPWFATRSGVGARTLRLSGYSDHNFVARVATEFPTEEQQWVDRRLALLQQQLDAETRRLGLVGAVVDRDHAVELLRRLFVDRMQMPKPTTDEERRARDALMLDQEERLRADVLERALARVRDAG